MVLCKGNVESGNSASTRPNGVVNGRGERYEVGRFTPSGLSTQAQVCARGKIMKSLRMLQAAALAAMAVLLVVSLRSEERRVGKECRL